MMADPLGVSGIAIGVAALFTTCLQVWDFVEAGRTHASNFSLVRTKLDTHRLVFVLWGRNMGFGSNTEDGKQYDERLDDPLIAPTVMANLNHIQLIFSDTKAMTERYGINIFGRKPKTKNRKRSNARMKGGSNPQQTHLVPAHFHSKYKAFLAQLDQDQKRVSFWKATRWSIKDEAKFDKMVKDLAELLDGLNRITSSFFTQARAQEVIGNELETIDDLESLAEIEEATDNQTVKNAISIRRWILEQSTDYVGASELWIDEIRSMVGSEVRSIGRSSVTRGSTVRSSMTRENINSRLDALIAENGGEIPEVTPANPESGSVSSKRHSGRPVRPFYSAMQIPATYSGLEVKYSLPVRSASYSREMRM